MQSDEAMLLVLAHQQTTAAAQVIPETQPCNGPFLVFFAPEDKDF